VIEEPGGEAVEDPLVELADLGDRLLAAPGKEDAPQRVAVAAVHSTRRKTPSTAGGEEIGDQELER
jgi:hypothetical protein